MRYSCFDPLAGTYRVFEDNSQLQVNGDLPVPQLPPESNGIGVPALDAARPLPRGAQEIGSSNTAVGIMVNCQPNATLSGFGFGLGEEPTDSSRTTKIVIGLGLAALGALAFYWWTNQYVRP